MPPTNSNTTCRSLQPFIFIDANSETRFRAHTSRNALAVRELYHANYPISDVKFGVKCQKFTGSILKWEPHRGLLHYLFTMLSVIV